MGQLTAEGNGHGSMSPSRVPNSIPKAVAVKAARAGKKFTAPTIYED